MLTLTRTDVVSACLGSITGGQMERLYTYEHLVAKRGKTGYAVVFAWPDGVDLTEEVYEALHREIAWEGLEELVVFSRYNLFSTDDVSWVQFPTAIMRRLAYTPAEKALEAILIRCRAADQGPAGRLVDAADIKRIIADYVPEMV